MSDRTDGEQQMLDDYVAAGRMFARALNEKVQHHLDAHADCDEPQVPVRPHGLETPLPTKRTSQMSANPDTVSMSANQDNQTERTQVSSFVAEKHNSAPTERTIHKFPTIPMRRARIDLMTPAELAILDAMQAVDQAGADGKVEVAIGRGTLQPMIIALNAALAILDGQTA